MNEKKIAFIVCTNNEFYMNTCREYIENLNSPEGYEVEILEIHEAKSMTSGYNEGREATDAKYKIYLHQDVFILYKDFLNSMLEIFESDEGIGMIGMVGAPKMPPGGVMWYGHREGQLYLVNKCETSWEEYRYELSHGLHDVQAVDGLLIATSKDIPWREDLFDAWDFYDVSQSFEYLRAGYKVVVPEQKNPWVMHYDGMLNLKNYDCYRKVMLGEYSDIMESKGRNEKGALANEVKELRDAVMGLLNGQKAIMEYLNEREKEIANLTRQVHQAYNIIYNAKYEILDPTRRSEELFFPKIDGSEVLIERLVNERLSLARFGDGEFAIMDNIVRQKFQRVDERLAKRLREVIRSNDDRVLIAIADHYGNLDRYTTEAANAIRNYMTEETRLQHMKYLSIERVYYDTYVTRPYVIYRDKEGAKERFANIRRIWNERDVVIVEGAKTRLGVGNDLFDNVKSLRRILAPATSSFDRYDDILESALSVAEVDVLFLIAMGPSAGVLAYDLTQSGYQAIDVGHVDMEYEWFLAGEGTRTFVKNKYNNEVVNGDMVSDVGIPETYYKQIIVDCS